ncbi:uncharacterized protein TNCV_4691511 [Trichonephila clavipes]|nr:uncharacterized protein TNCV_4691511 [Trichonephila clavipes]
MTFAAAWNLILETMAATTLDAVSLAGGVVQWCDQRRTWTHVWPDIICPDESRFSFQNQCSRFRVWWHRAKPYVSAGECTTACCRYFTEILGTENVRLLPWCARSSDLSLIENVLSMARQSLRSPVILVKNKASHGKTVQYEISTAYHPQPRILSSESGTLVRYVGDNADINVHILDGDEQPFWWELEINIQRMLSTSITVWFHVIQPIIFSFHREHFVDFGTHLLLTICVFIPWTPSEKQYNPLQSWV